jgi:DNA primase catalytic core
MNSITTTKAQNDIIDYIKGNISIQDFVNKLGGLQLIKKGKSLAGNCPTSHPSNSGTCFHVILDKNFCYCHSCGAGGSVIDLVMLSQNLDFKESLAWFKKNYNLGDNFNINGFNIIKTTEELKLESELKAKSFLLEKLVEEGKKMLLQPEGKDALEYLTKERKFNEEIIQKTELFYLPPQNEAKQILYKAYPEMSEQIKSLKLVGHYGDNFRLAFPYRNRYGLITGLMKRATAPEGVSGNTYDATAFKEQRFDSTPGLAKDDLFGLDKIKKQDTVIIVEGYPDAIYLFELGLTNIVAAGQGKLSKNHLRGLIKKGIKNVIIAFDNDKVGPDNTNDAVKLLLKETNIAPFVMDPKSLSPHKDPDEFVRTNGMDAFNLLLEEIIKGAVWAAGHILEKDGAGNAIAKKKAVDEVIELARLTKNPMDIEELISTVSKKLKQSKNVVKDLFKTGLEKVNPKSSIPGIEGKFWTAGTDGIEICMKDYVDFIIEEGFSKYYMDKEYTFVRTKDNIVKAYSHPQIKDHILSFVENIEEDENGTRKQLYETLYNNVGHYFNEGLVECIPPVEIKFKRDGKHSAYVYYNNGYVSLGKNSDPCLSSYENLESPIWGHIINERSIDLIKVKYKKPEYEQFLLNVVGGNEDRFLSLCSVIGYMMHDYKAESNAKAIVLCDQKIQVDGEPNGRTGKSLIGKALEKIKNVERVDGKNFGFKPTFTFQMVKLGTQIIDFNDVEANFNFERLFSVITDGMTIEYKNKSPFVIPFSESPKIMISTNYTIKGIGSSYKDRMFEIEFSDHYSPEHKPIDEFGHDFFSGWDADEWNRFDNFMLECLQLYLDEGLVSCALVNLSQRKLIDQTSSQFVEFAEEFIELNKKYNLNTLYDEFKIHIGYADDIFNKCPVRQNTFTMWLPIYAQFKGVIFKKNKSDGKQFISFTT